MKKCENCNYKHDGSYGSGRFCSSKCARGFSTKKKRKEINKKVSDKLLGRKGKSKKYSNEKWKIIKEKRDVIFNNKLLNADFNSLGYDSKRKRVILEQNGKCNKCNLDKWLNEDIPLELEHIDGNHKNDERNNLEALCPNCHALTPTWRGRNKCDNKYKISNEELLKSLIENNFNMRQALIEVGLAAKGGNYNRCHKLKKEYKDI